MKAMPKYPAYFRHSLAGGGCVLLFLLLFTRLSAQSPLSQRLSFDRIQTEDGLSHTYINALAQDSSGYLWFGTQDGLVRYDGYSYTTYRYDPEDSTSLNNSRIETLFVTSDGTLWIGTSTGLNRFRPASDDFERFIYDPAHPDGMAQGQVNDMAEDKKGRLWLVTQAGGLFRYDPGKDRFRRFLADRQATEHLLDDEARVIMIDREDLLWIGTGDPHNVDIPGGGLVRFNPATGEVCRFRHRAGDLNTLLDDQVTALMQDPAGRIWVGTAKAGLHLYNPEKHSFKRFEPNPADPTALYTPYVEKATWGVKPYVRILHMDRKGRMWIGSYGAGIHIYDPKQQLLTQYYHEPGNTLSLKNNLIWSFLEDTQGRIWIGNLIGGLHKVDPAAQKFQVFRHQPGRPHSLSSSDVFGLCASKTEQDVLWVATRFSGLNKLDLSSGKAIRFRHRPADPNSLAADGLNCVYEDRSGTVWVGTVEGLDCFDRPTQSFEHFRHQPNNPNSLSGNSITRIFEDSQDMLWVGTWTNGLNRLDRSREKITRFSFVNEGHKGYENSVYAIHEDRRGTLWTATWRGDLYRYDREAEKFRVVPVLHGIGAMCIHGDPKGRLWFGTQDRGVICFSPSRGTIVSEYDIEEGLPSNTVYGILPDDQQHLWFSTNKGLCRLDPQTGQVKNYDISDGLPSNTFNWNGACRTPDGTLFFGSNEGLVHFPGDLIENEYPPRSYITRVRMLSRSPGLEEKVYKINPSNRGQVLTLPYSRRDLVFEYLGLHYTNPSKNQYRYKLEPYETEWIPAGTQRNARYTNLSPGRYTFQMQAANSDGYWNETPANLELIIHPPWWRTLPAYVLYALAGGGLLWLVYRILIERERQRNEIRLKAAEAAQLREVDQMKSRFFANISHEFRTPLTLIRAPIQSLLKGNRQIDPKPQYRLILRNTDRLRRLIDQLLDLARLESGKMELEPEAVDLVQFFRMHCSACEFLARSKQIRFTYKAHVSQLAAKVDPEKMEKVCFNLLSNAFKFTPPGGSVLVELFGDPSPDQDIRIQVRDTGIGIEPEALPHIFDHFYQADNSTIRDHEGSGIGLGLVKEYVELHGGKIEVQSVRQSGTTFVIHLPGHLKTTAESITVDSSPYSQSLLTEAGINNSGLTAPPPAKDDYPLVLLVEDNTDMQLFLRQSIQEDYQVLQAENGKAGLALAIEHVPDLIISDVMMPEMDGLALCRALREDPRTCHIPIVLLTARAEATDRLQGIEHGAEVYLTKPFDADELNLRMRKLIEQRSILQQKYSRDSALQPADIAVTPLDEKFLNDLLDILEERMDDPSLSLETLGKHLGMSRSQLHRKLKALTGESPGEFLRRFRLQRAAQLLRESQLNISEIGFQVGFSTHAHFTKMFREHFGRTPSAYQAEQRLL